MTKNRELLVAWSSTIVACVFVAWTAATLHARISPFETLLAGLGAELPTLTRLTIAASRGPLPLIGGALVVVGLVAKEFMITNKWAATCVNVCAFIIVDGLSRMADFAMGMPMISLLSRIK